MPTVAVLNSRFVRNPIVAAIATMPCIRRATLDDLPAVEDIVYRAYSGYVDRIGRKPGPMTDNYRALIRSKRVHVLENSGSVQAILVLIPEDGALLLDNVAVLPSAKGAGFGRLLLSYAEHIAKDSGYYTIRLYTNESMTENISLYTRNGYSETHRAKEDGFNRVYMSKSLK